MLNIDQKLKNRRIARQHAEECGHNLNMFVRRYGRPGTISGEKMTQAQHDEYRQLEAVAESALNAYCELVNNTQ